MANSIIITKESNGNILVTDNGNSYTLLNKVVLTKEIDSVIVQQEDSRSTVFKYSVVEVEKVVRIDGVEITISDIDTLFSELNDNVFSSIGSTVKIDATQHEEVIDELTKINSAPYFINVNQGGLPGTVPFSKFGRNSDIDTGSAPEDIWHGGSDYTGFPNETETLEIFSANSNDTLLGTGARTVRISNLLDENYNQMPDVIVDMNGTTPVSLGVQTYHRCSRMSVETAGSGNENAGDITLRHTTTTANIFAVMPATYNQTQIFAYTVPAAKTLYVPNFSMTMTRANGAAGSANVTVRLRDSDSNVWRAVRNVEITDSQSYTFIGLAYFVATEKQDIKGRIESVSDNNTIVTGEADGFLVDNAWELQQLQWHMEIEKNME